MNENCVFVLDTTLRALTPCRPAQARRLLRDGRAAVYRRYPFTVILKEAHPDAQVEPLHLKIDPGSKTSGLVLVNRDNRVLFAAELTHRGLAISQSLASRAGFRGSRRNRKTRYRKPGLPNNKKPHGWIAPSLLHRVYGTMTWVNRFRRLALLDALSVERVKFDTQLMQDAEISGVLYQQGTLAGYNVREYLLEKFNRCCIYCDRTNLPLQVEHTLCKARGGTNRVSNLGLACQKCNDAKGTLLLKDFLAHDPERLARIQKLLKTSLKDAAAVNATRNELVRQLLLTGLTVETGSGAQTKFNRRLLDYPKAHWIDAACVGASGTNVTLSPDRVVLAIKATGHGSRQRCNSDKYGFPGKAAAEGKRFAGFQTGDLVSTSIPTGKFAGKHSGRVAIRHRPSFRLNTGERVFDVHPKYLKIIQRSDGYQYGLVSPSSKPSLGEVPTRKA
jgi:5-methylcytosine-specific restriction endonuclease McrA